jgi:hypothetical protein
LFGYDEVVYNRQTATECQERFMTSSYTREDVAPGSVRFTVSPGWAAAPEGLPIAAIAAGVVAGLVLASLLHWILGIVGGWGVYQYMKGRAQKSSTPSAKTFTFVASADNLTAGGLVIPRSDIAELNWTNWSKDGSENDQCSLYCETRGGDSPILATGMDSATASRLTAEVATVLKVSFRESKPTLKASPPGMTNAANRQDAARQRMERARQTSGTSDTSPIAVGDVILKEVGPNAFKVFTQRNYPLTV